MKSLPENVVKYQRSPEFDENSMPDRWRSDHHTKAGIWEKIIVLEGKLLYTITESGEEICLDAEHFGVVEPTAPHRVMPQGKVRFYVEFYR
jgi:tellurite resistance-related uncharacterized protein